MQVWIWIYDFAKNAAVQEYTLKLHGLRFPFGGSNGHLAGYTSPNSYRYKAYAGRVDAVWLIPPYGSHSYSVPHGQGSLCLNQLTGDAGYARGRWRSNVRREAPLFAHHTRDQESSKD